MANGVFPDKLKIGRSVGLPEVCLKGDPQASIYYNLLYIQNKEDQDIYIYIFF